MKTKKTKMWRKRMWLAVTQYGHQKQKTFENPCISIKLTSMLVSMTSLFYGWLLTLNLLRLSSPLFLWMAMVVRLCPGLSSTTSEAGRPSGLHWTQNMDWITLLVLHHQRGLSSQRPPLNTKHRLNNLACPPPPARPAVPAASTKTVP